MSRVTQGGVRVAMAIVKSSRKGWSVLSQQAIPQGTFVCLYLGEYLTNKVAAERLRGYDALPAGAAGHALLVVREHVGQTDLVLRLNIDATHRGNVAKFINHSCDGGNLEPWIVRQQGNPLPSIALFARRGISAGEELTFAYGPPNGGTQSTAAPTEAQRTTEDNSSSDDEGPNGGHGPVSTGLEGVSMQLTGENVCAACPVERPRSDLEAVAGLQQVVEERAPRPPLRCLCATAACLGWLPAQW
ncbi:MAG: hypothetical protein WDW38_002956 [Sanguina aurantia]